jgi:hypothetical protein
MKPNKNLGIRVLLLVTISVCAGLVKGQQEVLMDQEELALMKEEVTQRLQKHYIRNSGADNPDSVPFAARMRSFYASAQRRAEDLDGFAEWLRAQIGLSKEDISALSQAIAARNSQPTGIDAIANRSEALKVRMQQISHSAEAIEIGNELNLLQDEADQLWAAHFESMLSTLSRNGRRSLDDYLNREIAPHMSHIRVDYAGLYAEMAALLPQIKQLQSHGLMKVPSSRESDASSSPDHRVPGPFVTSSNTD